MRRPALLALLVLAGCSPAHGPPSSAYRDTQDRIIVALGLDGVFAPRACYRNAQVHGIPIKAFVGSEQCYRFKPAERIDAIWHYDLEGSLLLKPAELAQGADAPGVRRRWLEVDYRRMPQAVCPAPYEATKPEDCIVGDYHIVLIGRRTAIDGGYGQRGNDQELVLLDRLISVEPLAPARRPGAN